MQSSTGSYCRACAGLMVRQPSPQGLYSSRSLGTRLMVSASDSRPRQSRFTRCPRSLWCVLGHNFFLFTLTVSVFTPLYIWVLKNDKILRSGGGGATCDGLAGGVATLLVTLCGRKCTDEQSGPSEFKHCNLLYHTRVLPGRLCYNRLLFPPQPAQ